MSIVTSCWWIQPLPWICGLCLTAVLESQLQFFLPMRLFLPSTITWKTMFSYHWTTRSAGGSTWPKTCNPAIMRRVVIYFSWLTGLLCWQPGRLKDVARLWNWLCHPVPLQLVMVTAQSIQSLPLPQWPYKRRRLCQTQSQWGLSRYRRSMRNSMVAMSALKRKRKGIQGWVLSIINSESSTWLGGR